MRHNYDVIVIGCGAIMGAGMMALTAKSGYFALAGAVYGTATAIAWVGCHWLTRKKAALPESVPT